MNVRLANGSGPETTARTKSDTGRVPGKRTTTTMRTVATRALAALLAIAPIAACSSASPQTNSTTITSTVLGCPATPAGVSVGADVGDRIADFVFKDCNDNDVSLSRFCNADATWLYIVHTWCPHTQKVGTWAEEIAELEAPKGVTSLQIIYENSDFQAPTAADCRAWASTYGLKGAVTLYDPTQQLKVFDDGVTSQSVYLDKSRVISSKGNTDDATVIESQIDAALAR